MRRETYDSEARPAVRDRRDEASRRSAGTPDNTSRSPRTDRSCGCASAIRTARSPACTPTRSPTPCGRAPAVRRPRRAVLGRDRQRVAGADRRGGRRSCTRPATIARVACFADRTGSRAVRRGDARTAATATFAQANARAPDAGLTVVVALPKGTIQPAPEPILERAPDARRRVRGHAGAPSASAAASRSLGDRWRSSCFASRRGRDRRYTGLGGRRRDGQRRPARRNRCRCSRRDAGPVEFIPPDDVRPGQVGTLVDEQANLLDVTATIVDLAVRGWLTITELDPKARTPPRLRAHRDADGGQGHAAPVRAAAAHELFDNRPDGEALRPQVQVPRQPRARSRRRCTTTRSRRAGTASDPTAPACGGG